MEPSTMNLDPDHPDTVTPEHESDVEQFRDQVTELHDDEEDEEIPVGLMIALVVLAVVIAVIYLTLGGGHNHFH
jgi:hypothetical protein